MSIRFAATKNKSPETEKWEALGCGTNFEIS
jgi:hypothetical protein